MIGNKDIYLLGDIRRKKWIGFQLDKGKLQKEDKKKINTKIKIKWKIKKNKNYLLIYPNVL